MATQNPTHNDTLVFTRCIFFRGADSTHLERQVNYFLTYAPLAALNHQETNIVGEDVLVTLWFEPMPNAVNLDEVYSAAIHLVP
ncbi:MAG: hypothetical protein AUK47_07550 [Deltaproteobacteria bacterium CG2_30_63_29]|nr:MAG: hypothetical protein AUK47_07550 [Deltaproteobacteria bacterium CG2_30_63_29]PIW02496.1 MAG: hypothetical protein COW42_01425 [Deltaproteobacteria bacterium CG17_big_fil_post_rev_8_21_14_2_50_63_7]PJB34111.1 MAG: hypothetical protein CO108_29195 [Deltaproteobacteria bacterium CG_4_9_14_3_um_filter_63_12]